MGTGKTSHPLLIVQGIIGLWPECFLGWSLFESFKSIVKDIYRTVSRGKIRGLTYPGVPCIGRSVLGKHGYGLNLHQIQFEDDLAVLCLGCSS